MRSKENLLWTLVLILFFMGGYLHGSLPFAKIKRLLNPDKQIRILVHLPSLVPNELIAKLQKKSYTVRIDPVQEFDDLEVEIIKSPGPDLILIPHQWVQRLRKENLLAKTQSHVLEQISVDFKTYQNHFYPWLWFVTKTYSAQVGTKEAPPSAAQSTWLETSIENYKSDLDSGKKVLIPHVITIDGNAGEFRQPESKIYVYGWAIPKSTESVEDSLSLIKDLYDYPIYETALLNSPAASVLNRNNSEDWKEEKKAFYIRKLPLKLIKFNESIY